MKNKISLLLGLIFILDILLLIFLGDWYSKLLLIEPAFYAHESVLLLLAIFSLISPLKRKRNNYVEILFGLSMIYLVLSFFTASGILDKQAYFIVRQFMIFGYGLLIYLIVGAFYKFKEVENGMAKGLGLIGILCVAVQVFYIFYWLFQYQDNPFFGRNYYSPMIIMGLILACAYILTYEKNQYLKHLYFSGVFLISLSAGHDSLFLSLGIVYFSYLFLMAFRSMKIILTTVILLSIIILLLFIPSFADVNVQWRILYWQDTIERVVENYVIFGEGFGVPYVSDVTIDKLNSLMKSNGQDFQIVADDKYVIAPHNSFLSMIFHLGIWPIILLGLPLIRLMTNKKELLNKENLFLFISLVGITIFSSFNVILELPHSSAIFWIVYFALIFKLEKGIEIPNDRAKFREIKKLRREGTV